MERVRGSVGRAGAPACVLLLAVLVALAGTTQAGSLSGRVTTTHPVEVLGQATIQCDACLDGVLHLRTDARDLTAHLHAQHINLTTTWQQGYDDKPDAPIDLTRIRERGAVEHHPFDNPTATFAHDQPTPEFLVLPHDQALTADLHGTGNHDLDTVENKTIVAAGASPDAMSRTGAPVPGFWHTVEGPAVAYQGLDTATITGNFTLFLSNVTIDVATSDQGPYHNWTGYRTTDPHTPAGPAPNPLVEHYEVRVSTINVTQGTLTLQAPGELDYYGEAMTPEVEGLVSAPAVTGELASPETLFSFTEAPLEIEGSGVLNLRPLAGPSTVQAQSQANGGPRLSLTPTGSFAITETTGVQTSSIDASGPWALVSDGPWLLGLGLLLPLGAVAVGLVARARHRSEETADTAPSTVPINYEARIEQAHTLYKDLDYAEALEVLEALVVDAPYTATPWYLMGRIHQAYGDHERALQAFQRLREIESGSLSHDAHYHMAQAAWNAGNQHRAVACLLKLAEDNPAQAVDLIQEPGFTELGWHALDELPLQVVDLWTETEWNRQRFGHAQRLLANLLRTNPQAAVTYLRDRHFDALIQRTVEDLGPPELAALVQAAWNADRLSIATTALIHLARQTPAQALDLVQDPELSLLLDDLRVHRLLAPFIRDDGP